MIDKRVLESGKTESIEVLEFNKTANSTMVRLILMFAFMLAIGFLFLTFVTVSVSAQGVTTCCERTTEGAYCQDVNPSQCDSSYLSSPTSCDSTSFCQLGTCYDSDEGLCMERTPKRACEEANGLWTSDDNPPQCDLGCCVLGEQASFTTLQRCKKLAGGFGLQADFRPDVPDEISCIAIANAQDVGACVFESEFIKTCSFGTRGECDSRGTPENTEGAIPIGDPQFFKDFLCTAEQLNTNCQRTDIASCIEGKDEVYFLDTCSNQANIYDSSKANNQDYWERVIPKSESCSSSGKNCGNCDYLGGSICAPGTRGENAFCQDINCYEVSGGGDFVNGESWCSYDNGKEDDDRVGSRHFRHLCFMGEEIVEPCGDFRSEVCVEDSIGDFSQAGCTDNKWEDCLIQTRASDCTNSDRRDCKWIPMGEEVEGVVAGAVEDVTKGISGLLLNVKDSRRDQGACVPNVAPGLEFWGESAASQCDLVSSSCIITYEKGLLGGERECVDNCFCDIEANPSAAIQALNICSSIGDCGPGANYIGKFVKEGYEFVIEDEAIGPDLDLGIFNPDNAVTTSEPANPSNNPTFDQGASRQQVFGGSQPGNPISGNVVQELIVDTYNRLS
jgi:hypothetical protein